MAATTQVPLEVYLLSDYSPDAEYIDGEIKERPMGENDHSAFQFAICLWFGMHLRDWKIRVRPELRVQVKPRNFLVPDVAILDASLPEERSATQPPIAVFEVLSPENSMCDMMRKLALFHAMGIPQIWLIDPEDGFWRRFTGTKLEEAQVFECVPHGINFLMQEISRLRNPR